VKFVDDFHRFLVDEVNLNQSRIDTLQQKVDSIETFIAERSDLKDLFIEVIPAGSWAHRTIIRPVQENDGFDADVMLHLKEKPEWKPADYLEQLYSAFRSNGTYRDIVGRKTRCVRVDYAGDFHVDLVPYLERHGQHYITNRLEPTEDGSYELSKPDGFTVWIDERQRWSNGTFVKAVRLVKYLRDYKNTFTCKSIILTTLLGQSINAVSATHEPDQYADVPSTFTTLLTKLASTLPETMPSVFDPAGTGDDFAERYRDEWNYPNFRKHIKLYAEKAQQAYDEPDRTTSIKLWRDIFGDDFKPDALTKSSADSAIALSASIPRQEEQSISAAPFSFPMKIDPKYGVKVTGRCVAFAQGTTIRRNGFRQFDLPANGNRVPKNRRIEFTATTTVPPPYELYWKVRNGGQEAAAAQQLRGEITKDDGFGKRREPTAYAGTHYVECYVVKDRAVVAKDRQAVVVT
jgi:hypothetical protein